MQGGRRGRDPFDDPFFTSPFGFPDPFASFGGFGGSGGRRGSISSFFGGRDPFNDPFFAHPFGGIFGSAESNFFGERSFPNMAPSGFFERQAFSNMAPSGFIEQQAFSNVAPPGFIGQQAFANVAPSALSEHQTPRPKKRRGPIIEEINSDEETKEEDDKTSENPNPLHGSSNDGLQVVNPDDNVEDRSQYLQFRNGHSRLNNIQQQPQTDSFTFHSSSVTFGGANGAYHTSSMTRRTGSDGVTFEERKDADSIRREAAHSIHKGLHNKGHSVTRKLNPDGKVDTMQVLHNINQDELPDFEECWNGNAEKHLPGWNGSFVSSAADSSTQHAQASQGLRMLPSKEPPPNASRVMSDIKYGAGPSRSQHLGR